MDLLTTFSFCTVGRLIYVLLLSLLLNRLFLNRTVLLVRSYALTPWHTHTNHSTVGLGWEVLSVCQGAFLLCVFKPKKHNCLKEKGGSCCLFPPCPLPRSFLLPVHASGIPLDPLNEVHITGLAERGEWERRRGVTKEMVREGSTGLLQRQSGGKCEREKGQNNKES